MSATLMPSPESLTLSLGHFDAVIRNCDAGPTLSTRWIKRNPLDLRCQPNHNKGKISSEVEPNTEPVILQTFSEIQALLEDSKEDLKDESDKEMYEAGEEVDDKT
uniref:Uncharacterized protein n=1 Tax=Tanacetum cinerariifolium TaxID=118510 RepID=A0A6L2K535_TANCI|nr:hypothetical protein [Tanacetum cinerariifolium]